MKIRSIRIFRGLNSKRTGTDSFRRGGSEKIQRRIAQNITLFLASSESVGKAAQKSIHGLYITEASRPAWPLAGHKTNPCQALTAVIPPGEWRARTIMLFKFWLMSWNT